MEEENRKLLARETHEKEIKLADQRARKEVEQRKKAQEEEVERIKKAEEHKVRQAVMWTKESSMRKENSRSLEAEGNSAEQIRGEEQRRWGEVK